MALSQDELIRQIRSREQELMSEDIQQVYRDVVENVPVRRLEETYFINYFLPYFLGEKTPDASRNVYQEWNVLTGGPSQEMIITDHRNQELFRVPPIMAVQAMDVNNKRQARTYSQLRHEADLYSNHLPQVGERVLMQNIEEKARSVILAESDLSDIRTAYFLRWSEIAQRYGRESLIPKETEAVIPSTPQDVQEMDDF